MEQQPTTQFEEISPTMDFSRYQEKLVPLNDSNFAKPLAGLHAQFEAFLRNFEAQARESGEDKFIYIASTCLSTYFLTITKGDSRVDVSPVTFEQHVKMFKGYEPQLKVLFSQVRRIVSQRYDKSDSDLILYWIAEIEKSLAE